MAVAADVVEKTVAQWIARQQLLAPGDRIAVAVSGGADSVALLLLLHRQAARSGWQLAVAHYDHGWRPGASTDSAFVAALAARLELPFHLGRADVAPLRDREQAARRQRHGFFQTLLASGCASRIATGHTRDDQAETVLLRLLRGSGTAGVAGIFPRRPLLRDGAPDTLVRPLLACSRASLRAWLQQRGEPWREDPTNHDRSFARNWLREDILPRLRQRYPSLDAALASFAEIAQQEEALWAAHVAACAATLWQARDGALFAGRAAFMALPLGMQRRLLREAVRRLQGDLRRIGFEHIEPVLGALAQANRHPRRYRIGSVVCLVDAKSIQLARAPAL